jgi:predicted Ser/Thr protein kinase
MKRGIQIGDYVLAELLSTGGMGQVWLAHRGFGGGGQTAVAIKFPHPAGVLDPRVREGLLDEARLQMRLQHSNIPRVTDMGVHEGLPYFVMDYIAGRSLAQLLTRMRDVGTPLRFEIIAHIAREIGYALRYSHSFQINGVSQQVIHRDVAPKNMLVSGQGGVYVVDFGVSEAVGMHSSRTHVKGTLLYMAPEHALGFPTPKSDGWGLGAILWEMIEGRQFRGDVDADELRRAANEGRHAALARPGIPQALRFVTEGLLRRDERDRLTLDEVLTPLETAEFPPQRMALCELMKRRFGETVHRSGQTLHDFQMPEQLDRTIAAARVIKDAGPFYLGPWGEAFVEAGIPIVVARSGTRPVARAGALDAVRTESLPRMNVLASAHEPVGQRTEPVPAPEARGLVAASGGKTQRVAAFMTITEVFEAPRLLPEPMSTAAAQTDSSMPAPKVPEARESTPKQAKRGWRPYMIVPTVVMLTGGGALYAVRSRSGHHEEASATLASGELVGGVTALAVEVEREPERTAAVSPEPVVALAASTTPAAPASEASVDPAPETPPKLVRTTKRKRKRAAPQPRLPLPASDVTIMLGSVPAMEIAIDDMERSLTAMHARTRVEVRPGMAKVRWRKPGGTWSRTRDVTIEPGIDYAVRLDASGAKFKPVERRTP